VRAALSGLTTRGRCFLAAGGAAALCALVLGERDLLRVAAFLLALPLVAVAVVSRTSYRLACSRVLRPARIQAGQDAEVELQLDNVSRLPSGLLLMEDTLPYVLGRRPRFVLDRVEPRGVRHVSYPVHAETRGRYPIGPLAVRLTDPFGLCELPRSFTTIDTLTVTPVVTPLPSARIGGDWVGGGDSSARAIAVHGEDDAATREYRQGDDLRKVHWRSTARTGELMVRREEQPWQSRAALLLDARASAHRGDGAGSSFEWAVSAVASIAVHLSAAGYSLRVLSDNGLDLVHGSAGSGGVVLDVLSEVQPSRSRTLAPAVGTLRRAGTEGVLVTVLGALDVAEAEQLARVRVGGATCIAVLVDSGSWTAQSSTSSAATARYAATSRLLAAAGWRVLEARPGTTLATLWSQAASKPGVTAPGLARSEAAYTEASADHPTPAQPDPASTTVLGTAV